jgi:stress response protein YsnF
MLSDRDVSAAIGATAYGADGDKIGTVEHFFVDDRTGAPTWVAVSTGLFGTRQSIVPVQSASFDEGRLVLPVSRDAVRAAPDAGSGGHLSPDDEAQLRRHYGLEATGSGPDTGTGDDTGLAADDDTGDDTAIWDVRDDTGADTGADRTGDTAGTSTWDSNRYPGTADEPAADRDDRMPADDTAAAGGPYGDDRTRPIVATAAAGAAGGAGGAGDSDGTATSDGTMIRSEEQLRTGTEQVATRRMRLVKYVVTEQVQITVPIRREEIRLEEVPLDGSDATPGESLVPAGRQADGGGTADLPEEIVLHAERPVVSVEVVPVERVRLRTEVVEGREQVSEQVQREQITVDTDRVPGSRS